MRAKFKLEEVRFFMLQKTGSERTSRARGRERGSEGRWGYYVITPFPTAIGARSWKVVQNIFVLILAPDSPNLNGKEGTALQQLSRRHVSNH